MSEFYHVDRRQNLEEGQEFELFQNPIEKFIDIFGEHPSYENELRRNKVPAFIEERFPEGLSMHGLRYVVGNARVWNHDDHNHLIQTRNAYYIEHMYEQIRRKSFSDKVSRFQSWYAWDNKLQACNFPDASDAPFDVYRVEPSDWVNLDMRLLKYGNYGKVVQKARTYWEGEKTSQPQIEVVMQPPIKVKKKVQTVKPPK